MQWLWKLLNAILTAVSAFYSHRAQRIIAEEAASQERVNEATADKSAAEARLAESLERIAKWKREHGFEP